MVIRLASKRRNRALREEIIAPVGTTWAILPWNLDLDYQVGFSALSRNVLFEKTTHHALIAEA